MKRLLALDSCRGLAALAVVLFHYTTRFNQIYGHSPQMRLYFPFGYYGVQFFFLISGFVIFMTLRVAKTRREFGVKRFARLAPVFWSGVIFTYFVVTLGGLPDRSVTPMQAIANLTLYQTYAHIPFVDGAYWSLQIEVFFYAIVAFVLYPSRLSFKGGLPVAAAILGFIFVVAAICVAQPVLHLPDGKLLHALMRIRTASEYPPLFIAGIALYFQHFEPETKAKAWVVIAACCAWYLLFNWVEAIVVAVFCVLFNVVLQGWIKFLMWKPLVFMGTASYALYVVHQNIGYVVIRYGYAHGWHPYAAILLAISISIALASIITLYLEKPCRHFILRRLSAPVPSAAEPVR